MDASGPAGNFRVFLYCAFSGKTGFMAMESTIKTMPTEAALLLFTKTCYVGYCLCSSTHTLPPERK